MPGTGLEWHGSLLYIFLVNADSRKVGCLIAWNLDIWKKKSENCVVLGRSFRQPDRNQGAQRGLISMDIAGLEVAGDGFILISQSGKAGIASDRIIDLDMVPSERELICHKSPPDVIRRVQRAYFQDSSFFPAVNSRSAISQKQSQKSPKILMARMTAATSARV
jgi:hypothetical protein